MKRKVAYLTVFILFFIATLSSFYFLDFGQRGVVYGQEKLVYNLPYPGILPDHPLYIVKAARDRLMDFVTRDNIKKANLYLLFSDKRANMALFLVKKGKNKLAVETLAKGEKYFFKIPDLLTTSKEQGVGPSTEFVDTLKLSNAKHHEIINQLLKSSSSGQTKLIEEVLKINQEIKKKLNKL